jgi:hypothetical protein
MIVTRNQQKLLDIIRCTGYLATIHAYRLLDKPDAGERETGGFASSDYPVRVLWQLQNLQKIRLNADGVACMPHLVDSPVDHDMLNAIDIMLDLSANAPLSVSSKKPPFKLCFLSQRGDKLGSYGVVTAQAGDERRVCRAINETGDNGLESRTVIFILSDPEQRDLYSTSLPHYFAISSYGKYRYFKGA